MKAVLPIVWNVWAIKRHMIYCVNLYLPLFKLDFICSNYDINCEVDGVRIRMRVNSDNISRKKSLLESDLCLDALQVLKWKLPH